ncbi:uncharacterized protein N7503_004177 [Penicillium pulvis]|uniref:uncharacterized protein n=1 Tax=Penicillium pulvis TaxID=1562058 RepID=UPI0025498DD9|nr:uncharacterized protein N7503_004177 [Penicillium pulvis]KAJ5806575.1 hypothetical protein N7503_004177 [Penicillium pulvis]
MPSSQPGSKDQTRHRRAHTKSRRGCRNCKLRRIKCDEAQPQCQKCISFGVTCNYRMGHNSDLQLAKNNTNDSPFGHLVFDSKPSRTISMPAIIVGHGPGSFQMDSDSLARLYRFRNRTVFSFLGRLACEIYQNDVHPFLMRIILAVTTTHDRYLVTGPEDNTRSVAEVYHETQCAGLLRKKLSSPILNEERDALWSSAAMLGIASLSSIDASTPAEAWPLKPDDPSDFDWLNFSTGKKAIWRATDPLRPDSIFHRMAGHYTEIMKTPPLRELSEMAPEFVQLCSLDEPLACSQNPYYSAVSMLSDLWQATHTRVTGKFVSFLSLMRPDFRSLLVRKDARALLIFAYWYALISDSSVWFITRRARLECHSICLYLEKYHADDGDIQRMLKLPKAKCECDSQMPPMFL